MGGNGDMNRDHTVMGNRITRNKGQYEGKLNRDEAVAKGGKSWVRPVRCQKKVRPGEVLACEEVSNTLSERSGLLCLFISEPSPLTHTCTLHY